MTREPRSYCARPPDRTVANFLRLLVRYERYLSTFRAFFLIAFILMSLKRLP
jgi:hypothetical protein